MEKNIITTDQAPQPIGPYSAGVRVCDLVFASGQAGLDPASGEVVPGGIEAETHQVLQDLRGVFEAAGATLDQVVKTTVFLRDMADFPKMNAVYAQYFKGDYPARTTVQAAGLPKGVAVEIDAIAYLGS